MLWWCQDMEHRSLRWIPLTNDKYSRTFTLSLLLDKHAITNNRVTVLETPYSSCHVSMLWYPYMYHFALCTQLLCISSYRTHMCSAVFQPFHDALSSCHVRNNLDVYRSQHIPYFCLLAVVCILCKTNIGSYMSGKGGKGESLKRHEL